MEGLTKPGLAIEYKNFCPVSNLRYVSKLTEGAVASQLMEHITVSNLHLKFQSAYKKVLSLIRLTIKFCWNVLDQDLESLEQRLTGSHHICLVWYIGFL